MNIIRKLPGPLLVFLGACSLSFGGLIVKSFEGATLWQILFWRTVFFLIVISIYLIITYKKKLFTSFYTSGIPGFLGGLILSFGFCGYVFSMYNTTVANANFIIQTQTIFLAIFGYFLTTKIKTANDIGIKKAAKFPIIWPPDNELPTINKIPAIAKIMDIRVMVEIFSFKKKYPKIAKKIV